MAIDGLSLTVSAGFDDAVAFRYHGKRQQLALEPFLEIRYFVRGSYDVLDIETR